MAVVIGATRPCLVIGGRVFTDISSNLIVISGCTVTGGRYSTMGKAGATGYAVTAAKTLTIEAVLFAGSTSNSIKMAYSDNNIGHDSATALTNPVYMANNSSGAYYRFMGNAVGSSDVWHPYFAIPATKYLNFGTTADTYGVAYGYEV